MSLDKDILSFLLCDLLMSCFPRAFNGSLQSLHSYPIAALHQKYHHNTPSFLIYRVKSERPTNLMEREFGDIWYLLLINPLRGNFWSTARTTGLKDVYRIWAPKLLGASRDCSVQSQKGSAPLNSTHRNKRILLTQNPVRANPWISCTIHGKRMSSLQLLSAN